MRKALTVSVLALVLVGCTGQSGEDSSTSNPQSLITVIGEVSEVDWQPAENPDQATLGALTAALNDFGGSILLPDEPGEGLEGAFASVRITRTAPTDIVRVSLTIALENGIGLSLDSLATTDAHNDCADRLAESRADWQPVEVRGTPGCVFTNEADLVFLEWDENDRRLGVQSGSFDVATLISWLDTWHWVPVNGQALAPEPVQCSDPPPIEVSAVSPLDISLIPERVRAGEPAEVIVTAPSSSPDALMGVGLDWLCWDGSRWAMTHKLVTDDVAAGPLALAHPLPPGVTTTIPGLGVALPSSSLILIPDVPPGTYRLQTGRPVGGVTPFVIVEVAP